MKYRKKPVVIEAIQFKDNDLSEMIQAWGPAFSGSVIEQVVDKHIILVTPEGAHIALINDWIVKGIKGGFYPVKPDIFEESYEKVSDE